MLSLRLIPESQQGNQRRLLLPGSTPGKLGNAVTRFNPRGVSRECCRQGQPQGESAGISVGEKGFWFQRSRAGSLTSRLLTTPSQREVDRHFFFFFFLRHLVSFIILFVVGGASSLSGFDVEHSFD